MQLSIPITGEKEKFRHESNMDDLSIDGSVSSNITGNTITLHYSTIVLSIYLIQF